MAAHCLATACCVEPSVVAQRNTIRPEVKGSTNEEEMPKVFDVVENETIVDGTIFILRLNPVLLLVLLWCEHD